MTEQASDAAGAPARTLQLDLPALLWRACPALLVVGTWLLFHPYRGAVHDSRLYIMQAQHLRQPEIFGRDLFFAFGSQDAFTVFSPLFAFLIGHLGLTAATMLITAAGQALWLSGAAALALRLVPERRAALVGLVLVACMSPYYGAWQIFSYGEGFATPRLLVEGLSLWGLHALSHRRFGLAIALVVPALLLHPLVTAAGLCVGFVFLLLQDRRWTILGLAGAAGLTALVAIGVTPFDRLTETIDAEWREVLEMRSVYLFPSLWTAQDWSRLAPVAAAALASVFLLEGWRRHMMLAALLAGLGGVLVTFIGADLLHNLFVAQVQVYRTLWLLYPFGYLGAGIVLARIWQEEDGGVLAALVIAAWVACLTLQTPVAAIVTVAAIGLVIARLRGYVRPVPARIRLAMVIGLGLVVGFSVALRIHLFIGSMGFPDGYPLPVKAPPLLDAALAGMAAGLLWHFRPAVTRTMLPAAALLLVVLGVGLWDRRDAWTRIFMTEDLHTPFEAHLAPDARVFWDDDVRAAWLLLKRPVYVSRIHGAGIVFTRRTALTYRDRAKEMEPLGYELVAWGVTPPPKETLDRATLAGVCRGAAELDAMVLPLEVEGSATAVWDLPAPFYDKTTVPVTGGAREIRRVYLYRCADLR